MWDCENIVLGLKKAGLCLYALLCAVVSSVINL